ncbi:MAG: hypothetical protein ACI85O_002270 [Saprospiraceae bacterium]|jgi:hypothetical protein
MQAKILTLIFCLLSSAVLSQEGRYCAAVSPEVILPITAVEYAESRDIITISVVFHVVWKEEEENISENQILSQMEVLNDDFRALNDQSNVPFGFQDDIADTEIEFCLAKRLPNGMATSGIIRTQTDEDIIGLKQVLYTTSPAVDSEHYMNVWVADMGGGLNGMASFPGTAAPEKDGIVIAPKYVGTEGSAEDAEPYHLGRTLTHEIGHYLNLIHVFGPTTSGTCASDDGVEDTPNAENTYLGVCPSGIEFSCETSDMWMNFMNFTDDECMSMFSDGQKARMLATLEGERVGLQNTEGCLSVSTSDLDNAAFTFQVYPNPTADFCIVENLISTQTPFDISLYSSKGKKIFQQKSVQESLNLSLENYPTGLYFISIKTVEGERVLKVMKL